MMEEYVQFSAKTKNEAITKACIELGVSSDQLDIQVVSEGSSGFFGFGSKPAIIKVSRIQETAEDAEIEKIVDSVKLDSFKEEKKAPKPVSRQNTKPSYKPEKKEEPAKEVKEKTEELIAAQERQKKMMMNIFHDLRNPVFILKGYVEKINEQDRYLKMNMLARLDHLQRLIDDLFLSEKLEGNEVSMLKDAVEIDELIEEVALGLETSSGRKIDLELEHAVVWADETRMNQIFENLIGNAILYTPDNTKILVKLKKEGQNVVISVFSILVYTLLFISFSVYIFSEHSGVVVPK